VTRLEIALVVVAFVVLVLSASGVIALTRRVDALEAKLAQPHAACDQKWRIDILASCHCQKFDANGRCVTWTQRSKDGKGWETVTHMERAK